MTMDISFPGFRRPARLSADGRAAALRAALRKLVLGGALLILSWGAPASTEAGETAALRREPLLVVSQTGRHRFEVEIADTPAARATGLMHRTALADDQGMLFDFKKEKEVFFWMKNTLIPLDMLFVEASGRIAHIAREATPLSEELVPSRAEVRFVLEVKGGLAARLGIAPGDVLQSDTINAAAD
ncbi:hypothetical protein GCM10007285_21790 [Stappia taiwanensis]|nr:hypothetical protein GCM10007285_21790 [Stappia taiwanensis]